MSGLRESFSSYLKSDRFAAHQAAAVDLTKRFNDLFDRIKVIDFLGPLLIRLYLAPILWMAAINKFSHFQATADWFGNGLGLPMPYVMVLVTAGTELFGAIFLLFGFAVRWISIPLMVTMLVAAVMVHWQNGWLAIATGSGIFATERTMAAAERLEKIKELLMISGNYEWLTEHGSLAMLNNGIEFAATYFVMLLTLLFSGGGRYVSADYWIRRRFYPK